MFAKLRSNYNLSNVLVRILFVLAFVFANWQTGLASVGMMESVVGMSFGAYKLYLALASCAVLGLVLMFLLPVVVNFALNLMKIYSVPRAEYCLLAHAFFSLGFSICGVLNLVNVFTPVMVVWGRVLFPFISSFVAALAFYKVTAKLYFNDVTAVHYFKAFSTAYLVVVLVLEVLA